MKSDTSRVKRLRNHILLYCITDLKSHKAVVTELKKTYPNLEYVALPSNAAMSQVGKDLQATHAPNKDRDVLDLLGGVDSYGPEAKRFDNHEWDD